MAVSSGLESDHATLPGGRLKGSPEDSNPDSDATIDISSSASVPKEKDGHSREGAEHPNT